jgi:hypothetical protein
MIDYAVKRVGSAHEEEIRSGRSYCPTCGYLDDCTYSHPYALEWHGDSFDCLETIICSMCHQDCDANLAHRHQGKYICDEECWDERLRTTE